MPGPTFILDSAVMEIAGHRLHVALCLEVASRRVLGNGISTSIDDAMVTAFGNAVFVIGAPTAVRIDNAVAVPELVRECWLLGVEIEHGPVPQAERALRDVRVHLSSIREPGQ